jgi:hypothetical protein
MATTRFQGPVRIGTVFPENYPTSNTGAVTLAQKVTLTQNSTTAVSATFYLPAGAVILDWVIDNNPAWDSVTSATLTIGTAAAGTQYVSGVNAKTSARVTPTLTTTQLTNNAAVASPNTAVVVTITPVGATTTGTTTVVCRYVQTFGSDPY